jgi:hypothetical protein
MVSQLTLRSSLVIAAYGPLRRLPLSRSMELLVC